MADWFVYMVRCTDDTLYTGVARDVVRRVAEHNGDDKLAARYTRARRPVALVYQEGCAVRAPAGKREHAIKQLTRPQKERLIIGSK